jgi:glycosyltransferase involved in cell wall biosynthesis
MEFLMNAVIVTPALTRGDAISNDIFGMKQVLEEDGYSVTLSVRWVTDDIPIVPLNRIKGLLKSPDDLLIYHHSIGCEEAVRLFESVRCRRIVKYHNVTPPEYFRSINREVARGCAEGERQVQRLIHPDVPIWADSRFNGLDMQKRKPDHPFEVLAPFNQVHELLAAEPDYSGLQLFDDWQTNILVVGRVVPNKNVLLAVESFAEYHNRYDSYSRLILVGDLAQNVYCDEVIDRIRELGVADSVIITGKVTVHQLKAFFLTAQMLLTTSSHEGFCVPLIEAMGLRVPVVTVPNGAIPDTGGDVLWYAKENPISIAESMNQLRLNESLREERLSLGWDRYSNHFRNEAITEEFRRLLSNAWDDWKAKRNVNERLVRT